MLAHKEKKQQNTIKTKVTKHEQEPAHQLNTKKNSWKPKIWVKKRLAKIS